MKGPELRARLLKAKPAIRQRLMEALSHEDSAFTDGDFATFYTDGQLPPDTDWRTWLIMAGRGFGKTRAGAEWVLSLVRGEALNPPRNGEVARSDGGGPPLSKSANVTVGPLHHASRGPPPRSGEDLSKLRIALVAATIDEARDVMVEGPSGLLSLADPREIAEWSRSRHSLRFTNGAEVILYSGANGESLRGPEHHFAWCDELAKWAQAESAWNNLQLGLRMGEYPRALVTTTPRVSVLLNRIKDAPDTALTGGPTRANPHLPKAFVSAMERQYAGTRLGVQELDGRLLTDVAGSLWPQNLIEQCRLQKSDSHFFTRIVVGVDPPASANGTCGIIVCALDDGGHGHVLADCSVSGASPDRWAAAVVRAADMWAADRVVAEKNQGGDMVAAVLRAASANLPLRLVHAAKGKSARAEPVAALFEQGKVWLHGRFDDLEAQLSGLVAGGGYGGPGISPDRADACVWALWALMLEPQRAEPRISVL